MLQNETIDVLCALKGFFFRAFIILVAAFKDEFRTSNRGNWKFKVFCVAVIISLHKFKNVVCFSIAFLFYIFKLTFHVSLMNCLHLQEEEPDDEDEDDEGEDEDLPRDEL